MKNYLLVNPDNTCSNLSITSDDMDLNQIKAAYANEDQYVVKVKEEDMPVGVPIEAWLWDDATSTITRLMDMGIEPYLIASSLQTVLAQRLVRKLCKSCKKERPITEGEIRLLGSSTALSKENTVFDPQGCSSCGNTGYSGRIGIYELITITADIKPMILQRCSSDEIKNAALKNGMHTLIQNGVKKILNGTTSVEEILRVTQVD